VEKNLVVAKNLTWFQLQPERVNEVMVYLWKYIFSRYLILILVFTLTLFLLPKIIKNKNYDGIYVILVNIGLLVMITAGTYIFSLSVRGWREIGDSAYRMAMFLIPVTLFAIPVIISKLK
jgi:uncharacterized membrane protein YhaH (DUF805 family)